MQETHQIPLAARMHGPTVIWKHFNSSDPLPFRQHAPADGRADTAPDDGSKQLGHLARKFRAAATSLAAVEGDATGKARLNAVNSLCQSSRYIAVRALSPGPIKLPFARYSHGIAVPAGRRLVFTSGQLGVDAEGGIPADCEAQADLCFANIDAILAEDGMTLADVVRVNAFVTDRAHMQGYMRSRDRQFPGTPPASTLMIVSGFTRPEFLVEIEVIAAAE